MSQLIKIYAVCKFCCFRHWLLKSEVITAIFSQKVTVTANASFKTNKNWMTCDFTSFSTVFQLYLDDGPMIITETTE